VQRILSVLASLSIAVVALVAVPAGAQAATPTYTCMWQGQQSTSFYGSPGANAWMTQPMGNALYATDCYAWRTYGNNDPNKAIQQALNDCNGANLVVDGVYGALTDAAIRSVQSSRGRYGPQTRDYMKWSTLTTQGYTSCWSRY
jgi:hypothetical protein